MTCVICKKEIGVFGIDAKNKKRECVCYRCGQQLLNESRDLPNYNLQQFEEFKKKIEPITEDEDFTKNYSVIFTRINEKQQEEERKRQREERERQEEESFYRTKWVQIVCSYDTAQYSDPDIITLTCVNDRGLSRKCKIAEIPKKHDINYHKDTNYIISVVPPKIIAIFSEMSKYGFSYDPEFIDKIIKAMCKGQNFKYTWRLTNTSPSSTGSQTGNSSCVNQISGSVQNNGVSYANGTSSTSGNIVRIQGEVEIEKIVSEIIKHFGSNCIYDGSGKKYVDDIAYGDANSVNRRRIKSVLSSGAIKNLKTNGDFNDAVAVLIKNTDWDENVAKKMIVSFANALGLQINR